MKTLLILLALMSSFTTFAGTTFRGKILNLTSADSAQIKVKYHRRCDWFCDVNTWTSPEVSVKADGSFIIKSPHSSSGSHKLYFILPNSQQDFIIYYSDFNRKTMNITLIETLPAKIPVRLPNGEDAGPWLRDVVAGRKLELNEDVQLSARSFSTYYQPRILDDSFLVVGPRLFAYFGHRPSNYKHSLQSLLFDVPNYEGTKSSLQREGTLNRDFYTSISEIIVDNTLDNPVFEGKYRGKIAPYHEYELSSKYYPIMKGDIDVTCKNNALSGVFSGEYIDISNNSGVPFTQIINGTCSLGSAKFTIRVELPSKNGEAPYVQEFTVTSNDLTAKRAYFFGLDEMGERFNGHFVR